MDIRELQTATHHCRTVADGSSKHFEALLLRCLNPDGLFETQHLVWKMILVIQEKIYYAQFKELKATLKKLNPGRYRHPGQ